MTKKFLILSMLLSITTWVFAQLPYGQNPDPKSPLGKDIPVGMEMIEVTGGYKLLVPKGAKIQKVGSQIVVENQQEYLSRRLEEHEERFKKIEELVEGLKKQIEELQKKEQSVGLSASKTLEMEASQ